MVKVTAQHKKTSREKLKITTHKSQKKLFRPLVSLADEWCSHGIFMILLGFLCSFFSKGNFFYIFFDFAESLTILLCEKGFFFLDWNGFVALVTDIPLNISVKGNFPSLKEKLLNDSISFKHNANIYFSLQVCKACRFSQQYYNTFETKTFSRSFPLFIDFFCPHTILSNNRAIKSLRKQK